MERICKNCKFWAVDDFETDSMLKIYANSIKNNVAVPLQGSYKRVVVQPTNALRLTKDFGMGHCQFLPPVINVI
jgi:hypothetical protein